MVADIISKNDSWEAKKIAILGSGSWATALAKILIHNGAELNWYFRFKDSVRKFQQKGHNPNYLTGVKFDTDKIHFYTDVNEIVQASNTIILVTPSPYIKNLLGKVKPELMKGKFFLNAVKGIVPEDNILISDYLAEKYHIPHDMIGAIGGPCHAEEVAMDRLSYVTIACNDRHKADAIHKLFECDMVQCRTNEDVTGLEYASVLKNVYAIASGICSGMLYGDNFQAVLISNATAEMRDFLDLVKKCDRDISDSVYLGDLLVTAYSRFSRNRTFGTMIGKGYTVKQAQLEMEMVAEGYYGAKCVHEVLEQLDTNLPIIEAVYAILYQKANAKNTIKALCDSFI